MTKHELDTWVNSIKEILDDPQPDTLDLLDTIKLNLFASELNVFTPKGEIVTLPQGATVLDFAFAIHSMVGSHCMGREGQSPPRTDEPSPGERRSNRGTYVATADHSARLDQLRHDRKGARTHHCSLAQNGT